jgi:hypothetical protein
LFYICVEGKFFGGPNEPRNGEEQCIFSIYIREVGTLSRNWAGKYSSVSLGLLGVSCKKSEGLFFAGHALFGFEPQWVACPVKNQIRVY